MKKTLFAVILILISLPLVGCGGGSSSSSSAPPPIVTQILSDSVYDGDISRDSTGTFTVTQSMTPTVQSVFAGIDPSSLTEYRAFLDFNLSGQQNGVPLNAVIVSATLEIFINNIIPNPLSGTIPIRIDLVSFQPPILIETDFDTLLQPFFVATKTINPPISQIDFGNYISIDVTQFMDKVQLLGLPDFQVRILEDLGPVTPGIIEINDTTGPDRALFAPLLTVQYY
jgi:hypothetical protein